MSFVIHPDKLAARYEVAKILPGRIGQVAFYANAIERNQGRYMAVQSATGVPWFVIAVIHGLESAFNFNTWLANGDPLDGPTRRVPRGLTVPNQSPPFSWEESAVITLKHHGRNMQPWTLGRTLYYLEGYNGWGYFKGAGKDTDPPSTSPYLWSFTDQYRSGKYIADGRFDPFDISNQAGAAAQLKMLEQRGLVAFSKEIPNA